MSDLQSHYQNDVINFDRTAEIERICDRIRQLMREKLKRRGLVIAVSGGIDSSVCAAVSVKALGKERVFLLQLPETDSSPETQSRSDILVEHLNTDHQTHNIAPTLEAIGCYAARDEAIQKTFPRYGKGWKNKIVIRGGLDGMVNHFVLVVQDPEGALHEQRLGLQAYLQIVAATNYKQRIRKTIEYYHADRLNYAVVGTPNRLEYDQGFFVKNGDGSADIKPIAHLYKTQVYALASALQLPQEICDATPTTDTYSLSQGQDEFYFALDHSRMDMALWAFNHNYPAGDLAACLEIDASGAEHIYRDIENKRKTTRYLHLKGQLMAQISEIEKNTC